MYLILYCNNNYLIVDIPLHTLLLFIQQTKCHRYWPGTEPSVYGDIAVEMISEKEKEDWTIREFKLNVVSATIVFLHMPQIGKFSLVKLSCGFIFVAKLYTLTLIIHQGKYFACLNDYLTDKVINENFIVVD